MHCRNVLAAILAAPMFLAPVGVSTEAAEHTLSLNLRQRTPLAKGSETFLTTTTAETWDARRTAVIVCDVWDSHHSQNAVLRVQEMAPRVNALVAEARRRGAFIIHAPSGCMDFYKDHPARKRAQNAPKADDLPPQINQWCNKIPAEEQGVYPIDQSDGGEDDDPRQKAAWVKQLQSEGRNPGRPWLRQIDVIEIQDKDAISDSGVEVWNMLAARDIDQVILLGVHTNMCVLGRPFGLRRMAQNGKQVVLVRDMTDTMYNPQRAPFVSHFTGTDLIVEHIEKYVCPTILSTDILGGKEFRFKHDHRRHVVMILAEAEYDTVRTLPKFAREYLGDDFRVSYVFADPQDRNCLVGMEALDSADLLVLSARRRTPPEEQLAAIRKYVASGRPVVALRTASHAFALRNKQPPAGHADWPRFDLEVLGCNYNMHYPDGKRDGKATKVWSVKKSLDHPVLAGVDASERTPGGTLYRSAPLVSGATSLVRGRFGDSEPEPVAWTRKTAAGGRVFYTSLGHRDDFADVNFQRMLLNALYWAAGMEAPTDTKIGMRAEDYRQWTPMHVPGTWDKRSDGVLADYDGVAWYRCQVKTPPGWKGHDLELFVEKIDNAHEAYFNGKKIGGAGSLPPDYESGAVAARRYRIDGAEVKALAINTIAIRVFDKDGAGGFEGTAPALFNERVAVDLRGVWQFRTGDDPGWAMARADEGVPGFNQVSKAADIAPRVVDHVRQEGFLPPEQAHAKMKVADDLELVQVLAEPRVRQPLSMSFDERGRLWVVQYIQYPHPAGLKMVSRDNYWRAVYDKTPQAPPNHVRGKDKITIHEDTDGDGRFDKHKTFLDGLNITTAAARGRGGVWVLNPPYLLFYADKDNDDVPDGDPVVHLAGFGLEDTHSVTNSLRWGPDGWLYASQGSTVTAAVVRPGMDDKQPQRSMGQLIWRYHPESRRYEIFAEGGGNAFGVEFDAKGRVYSGHNGGNTRGFHYVQGGYYRKGFTKHGPLSNPYAFGFFDAMRSHEVPRFTHTFVIYESDQLPAKYRGDLFGVEPLQSQIVWSDVLRDRSSFKTNDLDRVIRSADPWFRPVDIKEGPAGGIYIADWYDAQVNHYRNHEGKVDPESGRIYRLQARHAQPAESEDLSQLSSVELVAELSSPSKWRRQTALRLLGDRRDTSIVPLLTETLAEQQGQLALEALWALNLSGGLGDAQAIKAFGHADPYVRAWAVRLMCDRPEVASTVVREIVALAEREENVEVRSQLASSARRLPAADCLAVVGKLLRHDDVYDVHIPLLNWWAIEEHADTSRAEIVALLGDESLWQADMFKRHIAERLMRRYAAAGSRRDLLTCAKLLDTAPTDKDAERLMAGFEQAFEGRSLAALPDELVTAMSRRGGGSLALRLRRGDTAAQRAALNTIADESAETGQRIELIRIVGQVRCPGAVDVLLNVAENATDATLQAAAISALGGYAEDKIARRLIEQLDAYPEDARKVALELLASRRAWTAPLLAAVDRRETPAAWLSPAVLRKMLLHGDATTNEIIRKHWGTVAGATTEQMQREIERLTQTIAASTGSPYRGKKLFAQNCGKCHTLFGEGGQIGPDLTAFKRDDLPNMLLSVVNPSAQIREGYENYMLLTTDGRALSGFIADQDQDVVVLRTVEGQTIAIERDDIDELRAVGTSVMPENVLKPLNDAQIRDLFAYLRSTQPLNN